MDTSLRRRHNNHNYSMTPSLKRVFICGGLLLSAATMAQNLPRYDLNVLNKSFDVSAPAWGPYSKKYAGISHIADPQLGTRFDFSVASPTQGNFAR